jgi:predicted GH43/DUF377 family glycosyl hydrolase
LIPFLLWSLTGAVPEKRLVVTGVEAGRLPFDGYRNWHFFAGNPVLTAEGELEMQAGEGNIYAPDVHRLDDCYAMWYGGQGRDGHDRIHLAFSDDGLRWTRHPANPVVDSGSANHVNDPTVVRVGEMYYLYFSKAPVAEEDEIHLATSTDGVHWTERGSVVPFGEPGSWDSFKVGRPSIIADGLVYKMWYDGTNSEPSDRRRLAANPRRHVGLATSEDGIHWTKHPSNPLVLDSGAVDVKRLPDGYILLAESPHGTRWFTSADGIEWRSEAFLFGLSGEDYDRAGQVTPMAYIEDGAWVAVYYGGAKESNWNRNRIAVAFAQKRLVVTTPDGQPLSATVRALDRNRAEIRLPDSVSDVVVSVEEPDGHSRLASLTMIASSAETHLRYDAARRVLEMTR